MNPDIAIVFGTYNRIELLKKAVAGVGIRPGTTYEIHAAGWGLLIRTATP